MSNDVLALVVTVAIFAVFFAWMPMLNLICPPCGRFLERLRDQKNTPKERVPLAAVPTKR